MSPRVGVPVSPPCPQEYERALAHVEQLLAAEPQNSQGLRLRRLIRQRMRRGEHRHRLGCLGRTGTCWDPHGDPYWDTLGHNRVCWDPHWDCWDTLRPPPGPTGTYWDVLGPLLAHTGTHWDPHQDH